MKCCFLFNPSSRCVLFVVPAGIGVTPMLPVLECIRGAMGGEFSMLEQVNFVWSLRDESMIEVFKEQLLGVFSTYDLHTSDNIMKVIVRASGVSIVLSIFCTSTQTPASPVKSSFPVNKGRPDVAGIVASTAAVWYCFLTL